MKLTRGRPKKDINVALMVHMMRNGASVCAVAKGLGLHRDTLYHRCYDAIEAGRQAHWDYMKEKRNEWHGSIEDILRRMREMKCCALNARGKPCRLYKVASDRCTIHQGK